MEDNACFFPPECFSITIVKNGKKKFGREKFNDRHEVSNEATVWLEMRGIERIRGSFAIRRNKKISKVWEEV